MNAITINEGLLALLSGVQEKTELRDHSGRVLGYFTPAAALDAELYERLKRSVDPEELERRKREGDGKGHTIDQVLAHLESLERPS